jgi:hypothetical protein
MLIWLPNMASDGLPHQVAELKMTSDCLLMASDCL